MKKMISIRAHLLKLFLLTSLLVLGACATEPEPRRAEFMLPPPTTVVDPGDNILKASLGQYFKDQKSPAFSNYEYHRIDLNDDGRRDALVMVDSPYGYWCQQNGCTLLIMEAHNDEFTVVNKVSPLRPPLYKTGMKKNGWETLANRVSGRWSVAKNVLIEYDGQSYPEDLDNLEPAYGIAMTLTNHIFQYN